MRGLVVAENKGGAEHVFTVVAGPRCHVGA